MDTMDTFEWTEETALSPNNLNEMQNIINDNIVNNKDNYSTDEVETNKVWIDNKPIYRKVLSGTLPTGSGDNAFTITGGEIISTNGFVKSQYGLWFNINSYFSEAGYVTSCRLNSARDTLTLKCGNFYNTSSQYFIVVEYTKTTD